MIKKTFTVGFDFTLKAPSEGAILVMMDNANKIVLNENNGVFYASAEETSTWSIGDYVYQIIALGEVYEEGTITFAQNLLLVEAGQSPLSKTAQIIEAIEAVIEGRATQAQSSVKIGDKEIQYLSLSDLLKSLQYFNDKLAKEEGKVGKNDEHKIKYLWR